jgi:hypothetical protein
LISVVLATISFIKMKSGHYDVVIDRNSQTVTIPATHKRSSAEIIPISEIKSIDATESRSGSGEDEKVTWQVKLRTRDDREFLLQDTYVQTDAERLATTLNARIHA